MATLTTTAAKTHKKQVFNHMMTHGFISDMVARDNYGCTRVGARIYDLRKEGVNIESVRVPFINQNGHRGQYCQYWIKNDNPDVK